MNTASSNWRTPFIILLAGCLISLTGFGIRSSFGLFLEPMTVANDWSRETFGLAMALQNLMWGIGLPVAGALADKHGSVKVIIFGTIMYALGVWGMAEAGSGFMLQPPATSCPANQSSSWGWEGSFPESPKLSVDGTSASPK